MAAYIRVVTNMGGGGPFGWCASLIVTPGIAQRSLLGPSTRTPVYRLAAPRDHVIGGD